MTWQSASPYLDEQFFAEAISVNFPKQSITIRVDSDVVRWFKRQGKGYQTRINDALRAYIQSHG